MRSRSPSWMRACALSLTLLAFGACKDAPEGAVSIVTGDETDVFSRAPAVTVLVTEKIALDGTKSEIARTTLPAETVDLGERARAEAGALAVTGLDASGATVVRGETAFVQWGAIEGVTLELFVQRTGELARMPRGPAAFDAASVAILAGRYVLAANGTSTILYDLLLLDTTTSVILPRPARSLLTVETTALVIDEAGASTYDLGAGTTGTLDAPTGGTFAEVAGGKLVQAKDGTQYIVGATRAAGGPSARVLVVDAAGGASFASLVAPRDGACATFVEGRGLVVYGGDANAAGAEVLATGATLATPLPFPADALKGCAVTALDNGRIAVAGGAGPMRVFDLACTTACASQAWTDAIPLVRAESMSLTPDSALVVGDDANGDSHVYRASATGLREVTLKTPRRGARLVVTPTNAFAVVGGGAGIEQYRE